MNEEARGVHEVLARVSFRLAVGIVLGRTVRAAAAASVLALIWALATVAVPIPPPPPRAGAALLLVLLASFPVLVWLWRPSRLAAARAVDGRLGLADRLSTAVELLAQPEAPRGLARVQIVDALRAAWRFSPAAAAPVRFPRETWAFLAACAGLALWAHFLAGWSVPGWPAARTAGVIHREGQSLVTLGQRLESQGQARGLPETRRAAGLLQDLGHRLQDPRTSRSAALAMLGGAGRQLRSAQEAVRRRLGAAAPAGNKGNAVAEAPSAGTSPNDADRLEGALRELQSVTQQLREEGTHETPAHLAFRLRGVVESLDRMRVPPASRDVVSAARRALEEGRLSAATSALGDAAQDLRGMERMLGDAQGVGEAGRLVQRSADQIAAGGPLGNGLRSGERELSGAAPPQSAPGPNPPTASGARETAPPPGPNQGSLPGQGAGRPLGAATPRLGEHGVEERLSGIPGEGPAITRDLLAPGRGGTSRLPAVRPPADVAHANDRAIAREDLPPAYVTIIRRYFEALGEPR